MAALFSLFCASGCGQQAHAETTVWKPLERQKPEADTLFMPDLSSVGSITDQGGFLNGRADQNSGDALANYQFSPGKYGPAVHALPGPNNYVFYPVDGLIPSDEFTVEFWARSDQPWSASIEGRAIFAIQGNPDNNFIGVTPIRNQLVVQVQSPYMSRSWAHSLDSLHLDDTQWHEIALTLKSGLMRIYVDGAEAGQLQDVRFLPVWSEEGRGDRGFDLGGNHALGTGFWISDVRVSATARIPNQTVALKPLIGRWQIDFAASSGPVTLQVGSLHPGGTPPQVRAAIEAVRTDKLFSATPIATGQPDASHPSAGHSGLFSYDWQVVDRSLTWIASSGAMPYLSLDSPNILQSGHVKPLQGAALQNNLSNSSQFNAMPPTDLNAWAAMVGDLVYHIKNELRIHVPWYSVWNEPEGQQFWRGTQDQYLDLYAATVKAIKDVDPNALVGGPEVGHLDMDWVKALIQRCATARLPLDFISFHDYSGDLGTPIVARRAIDEATRTAGLKTPVPLVIGEFNWSNHAFYKNGYARFNQGMWHIRSFGAAYTASYIIQMARQPSYLLLIGAHMPIPHAVNSDPRAGGYVSTNWTGPNGEQWAPYNVAYGWKHTQGTTVLSDASDLPPGVSVVAMRDTSTGRIGMMLANYGYAQRALRTVDITISHLPAGQYALTQSLIDARHSSRWDVAEDRPEGDTQNNLQTVERRTLAVSGGDEQTLRIELPYWSSVFINLTPQR